ncbi:MAG TPA: cytochrome C [Candidatus Tenderia electrophaga]|uniref:Cytochrome C n=1 Tax=Candidatus Tenderia electrophaga TaxID=1748243 RepID=A0A832N2J3_9GAMM|nr:cytochrome C [Candidatus Tenderia electrophaga]
MKINLITLLGAGLLVSGCASGPTPIPEAQSDAAQLYVEQCGACHAVPHPKRNTVAEWQHLFVLMEQRMAERGMAAFSAEEKEILMNYLQRNAR